MNKTFTKITAFVLLIILVSIPCISNAFSFTQINTGSSKYQPILNKRYQGINQYINYLQEFNSFVKGLDTSASISDTKSALSDKIDSLNDKYGSSSTAISGLSTKLLTEIMNSKATTSSDLISSLTQLITSLGKNLNFSIESLEPDKVIDSMEATTAGKLCGSKYQVQLSGKIYFAKKDKNGNPTSNKWVVLVHGFQMNGQAMADAVGQMYLDQGINVFAPDLRGFGSSKGSVGMGYLESLDVWDWLTYLNANYTCSEIFVHGVSLGGATTVFLSGLEVDGKTLSNQNVIGLIEDCGYTSMTGIVSDMLSENSNNVILQKILGIFGKTDLTEVITEDTIKTLIINVVDVGLTTENYDTLSNNLNSLAKCNLPLMIVHGTSDTTVPFKNSTEIYNAAIQNTKIPYIQRFTADGESHAFIVLGNKENTYKAYVKEFISQSEKVKNGQTVNKDSNYTPSNVSDNTSSISKLVKALKLIKNMI